ncbi:MocR-like pyridoxine biosynthesis transcription factor PdxR [Solirubrobacter soli]|uniref:MocR-like pyridoxine biosynthesis transcription factor PdxR n=1 Tax=Solirubrobacter soli TaxID=363832 RepID=UPI00040C94D2|nr:PLP-dependent aminotransferase family protein [Solirubrobacter soli]
MPENQASTTELLVALERGNGPLQRQLENQLRALIRSGRLAAGDRLPASRALAGDLGVSRGIVSDAYMQLAAEGWLLVTPRTPPRVASLKGSVPSTLRSHEKPCSAQDRIVKGSDPLGGGVAVRYDLGPGRPDLARFPRADWVRSLSEAVRGAGVAELDYPPIPGAHRLRAVVAAYRGRVRGTVAEAEDVVLCAGAGQAFVTIAEALGPVKLAVEDPGHEGIRALFAKRGLVPVPTRVDEDGVVVDELPGDARAVLLTPAHQFPTGAVLSSERRAELLRWAAERDALIIEDDYDAEYRYDRAPVGALQGLRPDLVVHVGSVSKTLAPALRLGWLISPPAWRERFVEARESLDHGLPALEQLALADFISRGAYDRHLRRSGRAYRRRRDALIAALARVLPDATVAGAAAGLHIALHIPGADEPALVERLRAAGVIVDGITPHRVAPGPSGILLSFAAVPDAAAGHVAQLIASGCRE